MAAAVDQTLIIGPLLTQEEKSEVRVILESLGQPVETEQFWNLFIDDMDVVFFERVEWTLSGSDLSGLPNISFEEFKTKYANS